MLNLIWPFFIIVSYIYSFFNGRIDNVNNSIFESTQSAINFCISLLGTMCLWNGLMQIVSKTSLIDRIKGFLGIFMKLLFPELKKEDKEYDEISMNIVANMLGLGNAATPLGLKAMKSMQKNNEKKDTLSDSMVMFIILNTASLQIIPTTVIAIRSSLGSNNPSSIIIPVWIATIMAAIAGVVVTKILMKWY